MNVIIVMGGVEYTISEDRQVTPEGPIALWAEEQLSSDEPVGPQTDEWVGVVGTSPVEVSAPAVFRDIAEMLNLTITGTTIEDDEPVVAGFDVEGDWHDGGNGRYAKPGWSTAKALAVRMWRSMLADAERDGITPAALRKDFPNVGLFKGDRVIAVHANKTHADIDTPTRRVRVPWAALTPAPVTQQMSGEPTRARPKSMHNYDTEFLHRRLADSYVSHIGRVGTEHQSRSSFEDDAIERHNIVKELLVRGETPNPDHLTRWQRDNLDMLRERALANPEPARRQPRSKSAKLVVSGGDTMPTPPVTQNMPDISGKADWYTTTIDGQTVAPHTRTAIAPKWITVAQDQPGDVWSPVGFSTADTREEALAHAEADAPGAAAWNVGEATVSTVAPPATVRVTERPFMQKESGGEDSGYVAYKTVAVNDNPAGVIRKVEDTGAWEAIDKHWNVIAEFDTVDAARDAIAEAYADVRQRDTDGTVTDPAVETWRIGDVEAKAAKLNERAEKKGLSGRVKVTVGEPRLIPRYNENGTEIGVTEVAAVTVSTTPVVLPGGWEYAGVIDYAATEGADNGLLHSASGYQLPTEFAGAAVCDDCGRSMPRNKLIVAADTDGNLTRLGTTCVKDVLGYDPAKLLWWANILDDFDFEGEEDRISGASAMPSWRKESFLATAQLAVDKYGYTKTSEPDSTKELVTRVWERESKMDSVRLKEFREYMSGLHDTPEWEAAKAKAAEIEAHINSDAFPGRNEFEQNIINAISLTHVNRKTAGVLAYTPMILARFNNDAAERAAKKTVPNEWIGEIGDKPELTGTVRGVTKIDGQYGVTVLLAIDTDQGVVKVFASGGSEFANAGLDAYETKTPISFVGTIKDHDVYPRGSDSKQTILTRVKPITTFADRLRDTKAQTVANVYHGKLAALATRIVAADGGDEWEQSTIEAVLFDVSEARGLEIQDAVKEFAATLQPADGGMYSTPLDDVQRSQLREFIQQQLDASEPAQVDWLTPELIEAADLPVTGFEFGNRTKKVYTIEPGGNVREEATGKRVTDKTGEPILRAALIAANPTLAERIPEDPTASMTRLEKLRATPQPDTDVRHDVKTAVAGLTQRAYNKTLSKARGDDPETLAAGLTTKEQNALLKVLGERRVAEGTLRSAKYADPRSYETFNANVFPAPGARLDVFDLRREGTRPPVGSRLGYMRRSDADVADQTVFTVTDTGIADPDGTVTTWDMLDAEWDAHVAADNRYREWERQNRVRGRYASSDPGSLREPPKPVTRELMVLSRPDISTPWQDNGTETIEIQDGTGLDAPTVPYVLHGDGTVTTVDGVPVTDRPAAFYNHFFNRSMYHATQKFLDDHDKANAEWVREQIAEIKGKRSATDQLTAEMIEAAPLPMDFAYGDKGTLYHITSGGDVFNAKTSKQVASQTTADKILLAATQQQNAPVTQEMVERPAHGSRRLEDIVTSDAHRSYRNEWSADRTVRDIQSKLNTGDTGTVFAAVAEAFDIAPTAENADPRLVTTLIGLHDSTQALLNTNGVASTDTVTVYRPVTVDEVEAWVRAGSPTVAPATMLTSYRTQDTDEPTFTVTIPADTIVGVGLFDNDVVAHRPPDGVHIVRYSPPSIADGIPVGGVYVVNGVKILRTASGLVNMATGEPVDVNGKPVQ